MRIALSFTVVLALTGLLTGTAQAQGSFGNTSPPPLASKSALYAVSIDEPLVAPPNAAIDVQLTFKRCHNTPAWIVLGGCRVEPALKMWIYGPTTHQLRHAESGRCVNISGARLDPEAWIILYPCSGAPNEKWTIGYADGNWTIRSDHSGLCLEALSESRAGQISVRGATLVQRPCNGSTAQQFRPIDSISWQLLQPR